MVFRPIEFAHRYHTYRQLAASSHRMTHVTAHAAPAAMRSNDTQQKAVVSDLTAMLQKVRELNNGKESLNELVPFTVDGAVLGRMRPE